MQLMSWTIARLGSRFQLLFEPCHNRVRHAALGRFLDQPLDLKLGLIEPDGTERVLPFTAEGHELFNCEQFERINSITFRGYSERYNLRYEFNLHSPFYPGDERLCIMPAFYLEMRVNPVRQVRWHEPTDATPKRVQLFIRVQRPDTRIEATADAGQGRPGLALNYENALAPEQVNPEEEVAGLDETATVPVAERLVSLNADATPLESGDGLSCQLPVTPPGSGIKWRLVWAAHVNEPVLHVSDGENEGKSRLAYTRHWENVDQVVEEALTERDDRLTFSRRLEKILEQAPIDMAGRHLLNQGFQHWLANTWLYEAPDGGDEPWFSVWDGSSLHHSPLHVEYTQSPLYLALWPELLARQLKQWRRFFTAHGPSDGAFAGHDLGSGLYVQGPRRGRPMEVEESSNFLLLLQAYTHWSGDRALAQEMGESVAGLSRYLLWADRDGTGFPSAGTGNPIDDATPATRFSQRQTHLAIKRLAALRAAADLLELADQAELAGQARQIAEGDVAKLERMAWLGDHYVVCVDDTGVQGLDVYIPGGGTGEHTPYWDAYSTHTGSGLLLPAFIGQSLLLEPDRLRSDLAAGIRESFARYGCGHTSADITDIWLSQNMWRDHLAAYLRVPGISPQCYWDLQLVCNTHRQSLGYVDTYVTDGDCFHPRGVAAFGYLLAGPRLTIDRLTRQAAPVAVDPDRHRPQRWPLLPLADWEAGKIPVCVVDHRGQVTIEGQGDPVTVHGQREAENPSGSPVIG